MHAHFIKIKSTKSNFTLKNYSERKLDPFQQYALVKIDLNHYYIYNPIQCILAHPSNMLR